MQAYCLSCKKHTDNIGSKRVIMINNVIKEASKCDNWIAQNSRFLKQNSKQKSHKKVAATILILNYLYIKHKSL